MIPSAGHPVKPCNASNTLMKPQVTIKNLSVNNVYVHFDLSERHDRRCQVVECEKAAFKLLVSHQQFAKAIEPTVRDFDNPASCLLLWVALKFTGLLPTALDMRDIAMRLNDRQRRCTGVACVGTQMFLCRLMGGLGLSTTMESSTAPNCETSCRLAPVTTSDNGTPRPSTSKWRLLPFFPPISGVGSNS